MIQTFRGGGFRIQFGLRTLLVAVTLAGVACSWIGWNLRQVHQREQFLLQRGAGLSTDPFITYKPTPPLPPMWRALGALPYGNSLLLPEDQFTVDDLPRVRALFPECEVSLVPRPGNEEQL
jgi:hypothetical protein